MTGERVLKANLLSIPTWTKGSSGQGREESGQRVVGEGRQVSPGGNGVGFSPQTVGLSRIGSSRLKSGKDIFCLWALWVQE